MKILLKILEKFTKMNPGTKLTLLDQMMVSGSNFLVAIIITRLGNLELYGFFALGWMALLFLSSVHQAFILLPMMSLGPKKSEQEKPPYFRQSQILQFLFSFILFIIISPIVALSNQFLPDWQLSSLFPILPLAIFAYLSQDYYRRYFFINGQPLFALIIDFIAYPGMIAGIIGLYFFDHLDVPAVYTIVLSSFGSAALLGVILAKISFKISLKGFSDILTQHWRFSSWLLGTALLQFFSSNYFLLAAAALLGPVALGALRIAQNLLGLTHVLFQAMENVVPVKAAEAFSTQGFAEMSRYLKAISTKSAIFVGLILLGISLFAKPIIYWVYGEEYVTYSFLLIGYCVFYLSLFPGYPLRYALRSIELTRPIFVSYVLSTCFSFLCAYPFVEKWGLLGVVAGLVITQILMQSCYIFSLQRYAKKFKFAS